MNEAQRSNILDREAEGLEERDVVARHTSRDAVGKNVTEFAEQMALADGALGNRDHQITGFRKHRLVQFYRIKNRT